MPRLFIFSLILIGTCCISANVWSVTFSDTDFLPQDWTPIIHVRDDPNVSGTTDLNSAGTLVHRSSGGNPGSYMRSNFGLDLGDIVNTSGIYIDETYYPSEQAITSLDFSYTVNHFNDAAGTETSVLPALLQEGRLFVGAAQTFDGVTWVTRSQSNLTALNFLAADFWFTGQVIHPDFSAFGEPIQFGYSLQNDVAIGLGFQASRGIDNWSVTINEAAMSDIHGNGVDNTDLALWQTGYGITDEALLVDGDFDRDLDVDGADFLKWQREFIPTGTLQTVAVPEPSTIHMLLLLGASILAGVRPKL